jgi:hypothetical protein
MKRMLYFVLVLLVIISLTGCDRGRGTTTKTGKAYIGGEKGLSIEFDEDAPPEEVMDDGQETFPIRLKIKNEGEYTIPRGGVIASLSGISKEDFGLNSLHAKSDFELQRKEKTTGAEGEENILDFDDAKFVNDLAADFETTVFADVCYKYRSVAAASICLKRDTVQSRKNRDACDIRNGNVDYENSGAPIQVHSIKQFPGGANRVTFTFVVENKGDGRCYRSNQFTNECVVEDELTTDEVDIEITSPSRNIHVDCDTLDGSNKGTIKLFNNKRTVTCSINTGSLQKTAYEGRVNIKLDYFYRNKVKKDITVKNAVIL